MCVVSLSDCGRHLREPELKLMDPAVQLLSGIAMASDPAAAYVIPQVLPLLLSQYSSMDHVSSRWLYIYVHLNNESLEIGV